MRVVTPTLSLCALAAAFTAGALTVDPPPRAAPPAASTAATSTAGPAVITISTFAFSAVTAAPGSTVRVVILASVDDVEASHPRKNGHAQDYGGQQVVRIGKHHFAPNCNPGGKGVFSTQLRTISVKRSGCCPFQT